MTCLLPAGFDLWPAVLAALCFGSWFLVFSIAVLAGAVYPCIFCCVPSFLFLLLLVIFFVLAFDCFDCV